MIPPIRYAPILSHPNPKSSGATPGFADSNQSTGSAVRPKTDHQFLPSAIAARAPEIPSTNARTQVTKLSTPADLPADQSAFMARSQVPNFADNFKAVITAAAWRSKPSWMLVAGSDRTINPELERWYAKRANSHTIEVPGASHAVYVSHPKEVAATIEDAAAHAEVAKN